jgi:hypothetical protein
MPSRRKPLRHNADFVFGGELAAGYPLDIPDELSGFLGPGFSLPD